MTKPDIVRQPGQALPAGQPADFEPVREGKTLLRRIRSGALATLDREDGTPFASLVNVATAFDGTPLLLLSGLAAHRANIEADSRVSLLLAESGKGDPLAHARLTVVGRAELAREDGARERFLARHPKSARYADFPDFDFFRIVPAISHLNGGFARAARLSRDELLVDCPSAGAVREAEKAVIEHMNADHADAVRLYATRLLGAREAPWRLTGVDPEGLDLAYAEDTLRLWFPETVTTPQAMHRMLVDLAEQARAARPE